jgi:hypothetical protein
MLEAAVPAARVGMFRVSPERGNLSGRYAVSRRGNDGTLCDTTCSIPRLGLEGRSPHPNEEPMPSTVKNPSGRKIAAGAPENRTASEIVADTILARYSDLGPSVRRIMQAGLSETGQLHAITIFQQSLGVPDDPMRYPLNAIAAGRMSTEPG